MKEYKIIHSGMNTDELTVTINKMASQGWRVHSFEMQMGIDNGYVEQRYSVLMERDKGVV